MSSELSVRSDCSRKERRKGESTGARMPRRRYRYKYKYNRLANEITEGREREGDNINSACKQMGLKWKKHRES